MVSGKGGSLRIQMDHTQHCDMDGPTLWPVRMLALLVVAFLDSMVLQTIFSLSLNKYPGPLLRLAETLQPATQFRLNICTNSNYNIFIARL